MRLHISAADRNSLTLVVDQNQVSINQLMVGKHGAKAIQVYQKVKWEELEFQFLRLMKIMFTLSLKQKVIKVAFINQLTKALIGPKCLDITQVEITIKKLFVTILIAIKFLQWILGCIILLMEEKHLLIPAKN